MLKSLLISLGLHCLLFVMLALDHFMGDTVKIKAVNVNLIMEDAVIKKKQAFENDEKQEDNKKQDNNITDNEKKQENRKNITKMQDSNKLDKNNKTTQKKNNSLSKRQNLQNRKNIVVSKEIDKDQKLEVEKEQFKNDAEELKKSKEIESKKNESDELFDKMLDNIDKKIEKDKEKEEFLNDIGVDDVYDEKYELAEEDVKIINQQFSQCWFATVGFLNSDVDSINLKLHMNINGSISKIEINEDEMKLQDERFQVLLNQVTRALKNPKCSIIKLPKNEYYKWKIIYIKFKPERKI